jgi:galactokinase
VIDPEQLAQAFEAQFGRPARLYRAPGRVNLIDQMIDSAAAVDRLEAT